MSFGTWITNPSGIKNSVFTNRQVYADLYKTKLDKILVRETGKIQYELYEDKKKGEYFVYMKIPSEPIPNFYYDVVIQFYTNNQDVSYAGNIKNYFVKFYSNDPAFVYTFAHAMAKNNLFITDLSEKMSKKPLKTTGTQRNPKDEIGYVKSLYFAYLTMIRYNLFEKVQFRMNGKPYVKTELLKTIEHADTKIEKRQAEEEKLQKEKRKSKMESRKQEIKLHNTQRAVTNPSTMSKSTPAVKNTKMAKRTATTKRTKKI